MKIKKLTSVQFINELRVCGGVMNDGVKRVVIGESQALRGGVIEGDIVSRFFERGIDIHNVCFSDTLTVCQFFGDEMISFTQCDFPGGLHMTNCKASLFELRGVSALFLQLKGHFSRGFFRSVDVKELITFSSTSFRDCLEFFEVSAHAINLHQPPNYDVLQTPMVKTDDVVFVRQLELARIRVVVSTDVAKKILRRTWWPW